MLARNPVWIALATAVALAGCVESEERSISYKYIHATIIEPSCATSNCHSAMTAAGPVRPGFSISIDLSEPDNCDPGGSGSIGGDLSSWVDVVEHNPDATDTLVPFLRGQNADGSPLTADRPPEERLSPMPLDGPLPPSDIELIARWIEEGASCE